MAMEWDGPIAYHFVANDNPHPNHTGRYDTRAVHLNVTYQHNVARRLFLDSDYDALLSIEADMIVPPDTIKRLTAVDGDIVYGLYALRPHDHFWSAFTELEFFGGISMSQKPDVARASWGKAVDVAGIGMGCTLIRRHVLKNLRFELFDGFENMMCDDWAFSWCAQIAEYRQVCDLGCVCGHYIADGLAIYPDPAEEKLYRTVYA